MNYDPQPMVWVRNDNKMKDLFRDKFAGQPHAFPYQKRVKCLRAAANHFFAFDARERLADAQKYLAGNRTPQAVTELQAAEAHWQDERVRVLARNGWGWRIRQRDNGPDTIEPNPKADEILDNFRIEPIAEETAVDEAFAEPAQGAA